jgi:hypothetical protein
MEEAEVAYHRKIVGILNYDISLGIRQTITLS